MGALNHSQYLYKSRPWEQHSVLYFDIFNIEMPRIKIDVRNIDIIKVSPLMIDGYRYWLNNISRYSYNFYNLKSITQIYIKTNNLIFYNLSWSKLETILQFFFLIYMLNSFRIILKNLENKFKTFKKTKNYNLIGYFYIFLVDNSDLLNIKFLQNFSKKFFGYNIYLKNNKLPSFFKNNLNFCFLKKNLDFKYINLELNNLKAINFQILNKLKIYNNYHKKKKYMSFNFLKILLFDIFFIKVFDININITKNKLIKFILYYNIYKFFNNFEITYQKFQNFYINYDNISNLNSYKIIAKKKGFIFFNTLLEYNLNYLGNNIKSLDIKKNYCFSETLFIYDNTSFVNWLKFKNYKIFIKKILPINYSINNKLLVGITIPAKNILNINKNLYINSFGNIIKNNSIFILKNLKNFQFIFSQILSKKNF